MAFLFAASACPSFLEKRSIRKRKFFSSSGLSFAAACPVAVENKKTGLSQARNCLLLLLEAFCSREKAWIGEAPFALTLVYARFLGRNGSTQKRLNRKERERERGAAKEGEREREREIKQER